VRWFGWLAPNPGEDRALWRGARNLVVAPFTQLTFVSFDLQMFLFDVFHTSRAARLGHGVGMTGVTTFTMALAVTAMGTPWGGVLVAIGLLAWYGVVAFTTRLPLWWAVTVGLMGALVALAVGLAASLPPLGLLVGLLGSGAVVSLSHAFEPYFPPRAGHPLKWVLLREFLLGTRQERLPLSTVARRFGRVAAYAFIGWVNELWASPRLLPYNVLRLMLAAGYAPELRAALDDRARRAWASGNPALDFVGIGGGAFLPAADAPRSAS
jgi:hypothetical protein